MRDAAVGDGAAHEGDFPLPGQPDVPDELGLTGQMTCVFLAQDPGADASARPRIRIGAESHAVVSFVGRGGGDIRQMSGLTSLTIALQSRSPSPR